MHFLFEFITQVVAEFFFDTVCGFVGSWAVWLITFGRVDLDPIKGGESVWASILGLFVILGIIAGIVLITNAK